MDLHAILGRRRRGIATAIGIVAMGGGALVGAGMTNTASAAGDDQPFTVAVPTKAVEAWTSGRVTYFDAPVTLKGGAQPFELWSTRTPSYKTRISTVWKSPNGDVTLPIGTMKSFRGLHDFFRIKIKDSTGKIVYADDVDACLNGPQQRIRPDAPARSPYPEDCPYNLYTLGSVMGVQAGWQANVSPAWGVRYLAPGRYTVSLRVRAPYPDLFGMNGGTGGTFPVVVRKADLRTAPSKSDHAGSRFAKPSRTTAPDANSAGTVANTPDLRSLPASGAVVSGQKWLNFSATVWNAGSGPLVVDGFPGDDPDRMEAYQYFFNSAGEQTGYQKVGAFHWHAGNHNHWHFEDFASYQLLDADMKLLKTSGKVSFCLANTDAVDYTRPGADWNPVNTDLATACGDQDSVAIREVLAAGSGDTYMQYRTGQAFFIDNVPNGDYWIRITANPHGALVEGDKSNNVSLRKVTLSGSGATRKVTMAKVGLINEPQMTEEDFRATAARTGQLR